MQIAIAQLNFHVGNFEENSSKIINAIAKAEKEGAELIVFPELAICGYPPRDFLEFDEFIEECLQSINKIAAHCNNIAAIVGGPSRNTDPRGKRLHNSAFLLNNGKVESVFHKTLLPNYDVFDEYRYFEPNDKFQILNFKGEKIALTICEDLWNIVDHLYDLDPMEELEKQGCTLMINIAASPFNYQQADTRLKVLKTNFNKYQVPLVYCNHSGAQTELIFDGGSLFINKEGKVAEALSYFQEDFKIIDTNNDKKSEVASNQSKIENIHNALILGIRDYFRKLGFKKALLGLSGGIDSAVVFALAAEALGSENVMGVLMPSQFSSDHSIGDAKKLAENLNAENHLIEIESLFSQFTTQLAPIFKDLPFGLAEENLQARVRGTLLMAVSNKFGHILLNTTNKSEAAVGYGTLYGDMNGGLSVLGDVYKTEVYELAHHINRNSEIIPINSIIKPPSAELRPGQKDSDSLPEYDVLDKILYQYIELRKGPEAIIQQGFEEQTVRKILKMVNISEYKRHQTPPILRVSSKSFGTGRRMPIVGKYLQ
ncbi:MAG: NAD+ synthase [Bacteroidetes bacterium]|nr:NAD+ synthase [Bacteroidota bacterium]